MKMTESEEAELVKALDQFSQRCRPGRTCVLFVFEQETCDALVISRIGVNAVVSLVVRWAMARLSEYVQLHEKRMPVRPPADA